MKLIQNSERFEFEAWTDGHPIQAKLTDKERGVEMPHIDLNELHDLHYATGRMIARIEAEQVRIDRNMRG